MSKCLQNLKSLGSMISYRLFTEVVIQNVFCQFTDTFLIQSNEKKLLIHQLIKHIFTCNSFWYIYA